MSIARIKCAVVTTTASKRLRGAVEHLRRISVDAARRRRPPSSSSSSSFEAIGVPTRRAHISSISLCNDRLKIIEGAPKSVLIFSFDWNYLHRMQTAARPDVAIRVQLSVASVRY